MCVCEEVGRSGSPAYVLSATHADNHLTLTTLQGPHSPYGETEAQREQIMPPRCPMGGGNMV